jgi:hypothetical protein
VATRDLEQRISAFLKAAEPVVKVGIREQIDTRRIIYGWYERNEEQRDDAELRDQVAALLARNAEELQRLGKLFSQYLGQRPVHLGGVSPPPPPGFPAWSIVVALAGVMLLGIAYAVPWRSPGLSQPNQPHVSEPDAGLTRPFRLEVVAENGSRTQFRLVPGTGELFELAASRTVRSSRLVAGKLQPEDLWPLSISFFLFVLGVRLLLVVDASRRLRKAAYEWRMTKSREQRRGLVAEAAARGDPEQLTYHVPLFAAFSGRALDDIATALGRIHSADASPDLDIDETIADTLKKGGRFSPKYESVRRSRALLILVDIENDEHPWLGLMERTVDALERRGVVAVRYRFKHRPNQLFSVRGVGLLRFDELCRRYANMALIILSRNLDPRDFNGQTAEWLDNLKTFERRVWLDPDPRPLAGPRADRCQGLLAAGLQRVPFSVDGWIAAARLLSGVLPRLPEWPRLPDVAAVEPAIRAWALTAALVPDATWDQLEAIRRDALFPEIGGQLNEPHHLQLLLDWVEVYSRVRVASAKSGASSPEETSVSSDGGSLILPPACVQALLVEQRRRDRMGNGLPLEVRARQLLLRQLASESPAGKWARLRWELKRASHELVLDPERAESLLLGFEGTPIEEVALNVLGAELERQKAGDSVRDRPPVPAALARLEELRGADSNVNLKRLGFGQYRLYLKAALFAALATAAAMLFFLVLAGSFASVLVRSKVDLELLTPQVLARPSELLGTSPR